MRSRKPHALPVSINLLIDNLREQSEEVRAAEIALDAARALRDSTIQDIASWVPVLRLVKVTGLSRESIYRIVTKAGQDER